MKTVYLFVGAPGMGKTTLCNFQSLPVIHYDDYSRDKTRQKMKISCIDFCVQLINTNENENKECCSACSNRKDGYG